MDINSFNKLCCASGCKCVSGSSISRIVLVNSLLKFSTESVKRKDINCLKPSLRCLGVLALYFTPLSSIRNEMLLLLILNKTEIGCSGHTFFIYAETLVLNFNVFFFESR